MKQKAIRISLIVLALSLTSVTVHGQWWDPLGLGRLFNNKEERKSVTGSATEEQDRRAQEIYDSAMEELEKGNDGRANRLFKKVTKQYRQTKVAPRALLRIARIQKDNNRFDKAFKTTQNIIRSYPDFPQFNDVIRTQFEIATNVMEGRRGRFLLVIPKLKNVVKARQYFEAVISNAPYSEYSPMALMNIAIISDQNNDQGYAIDSLDRLINFYPDSMFGPDAYYRLGEIFASMVDGPYYDQSATERAISYYEDFLILYPDDPEVERAEAGLREMREVLAESKFLLGEFYYLYRSNTTAALVYYNETITVAPNSETAKSARTRIERIREGKPPPLTGIGLAQLWNLFRKKEIFRDADLINREQEELEKAEESEVIPAAPSPQG